MVDEGNGKIFLRPKTFREVAPALALAREVAEKHVCFCAIMIWRYLSIGNQMGDVIFPKSSIDVMSKNT